MTSLENYKFFFVVVSMNDNICELKKEKKEKTRISL